MHKISQNENGSWYDYSLPLSEKQRSKLPFLSFSRKDMPVSFVSRGNDFEEMRGIKRRPIEQSFGVRYLIPSVSYALPSQLR